jgi:hypothetical protein
MNEEGWYIDPFGLHEARWISGGTPTALVRDGGVESQDPPPNDPITAVMVPWGADPPNDGGDLKRADDAERQEFNPDAMRDAAERAIDSATGF